MAKEKEYLECLHLLVSAIENYITLVIIKIAKLIFKYALYFTHQLNGSYFRE